MNMKKRIPKGQELYKDVGDEYAMSACGILLMAVETLHPTSAVHDTESAVTITRCNRMVQRLAGKAAHNGCSDIHRWVDQLTSTSVPERRAAADEIVSWMTFAEFHQIVTSIKD